ncbi:DUF4870 family protein [Rhodocyclus gracilis]|nr:hypothetical protein [Rhodocyclus gracilis]
MAFAATGQTAAAARAQATPEESSRTILFFVYGLMAAGWVTGGLLGIVAIILAYIKRDDARGTWCESHFSWAINTFWISLGLAILGVLTILIGIGFILLFFVGIWSLYRIIKGLIRAVDRIAIR